MAYQEDATIYTSIWALDNRCSNYVINVKSLFKELDETFKVKVTLGDNKHMQVEGKGTRG